MHGNIRQTICLGFFASISSECNTWSGDKGLGKSNGARCGSTRITSIFNLHISITAGGHKGGGAPGNGARTPQLTRHVDRLSGRVRG